ncbi:DUF4258 domain-containing protein [Thioalkalivibrio sp. XN8]|uniref:DUF4258 domain-containing protein n=1 Tax=Thioalkalivibrio sp. XN8 TaxID=2712863 RepID=UPI0013EBB236|nr:DUF4258 domain-containing protein [Thioalkalivibrio sp. XN8]
MNPGTARKHIRERASRPAGVLFVDHARKQMRRRDVDALQVQRCLLRGEITEGPYVPIASRTGTWRCNIEANVSGDQLRVVVEIPEDATSILVITVIRVG